MKKSFLIAIALVCCQFVSAQLTKDPGDFSKLKVYDRISAELIPSDENKVVISGDRSKDVIVVNNNGELKLAMPPQKLLQGEEIEAQVFYKQLKSIDASEGAFISSQKEVESARLEITAKEGAEIKLTVNAEILKVRSVTAATIRLEGKATEQDISIGTGGIVEAQKLETERTEVSINAGGEAEVYASRFVKARTKAGGEIIIHGNPQTVDKKSILGGTITQE